MAAHRYWRVFCRRNGGDGSFTGLSEIEMRIAAGGADQCTGGTPGSSGSIQAGSAANCFDNNTGTGIQWSGTGANQYVSYDFGAGNEKDIIEVNILPKHDVANRTFGEFDVQYSDDGSSWSTYWSCSYTAWVIGTTVTFTRPNAEASRYWRVRLDESFTGSGSTLGLAEIEMKEAVGGADQCSGGTASARTTFSGTSAANCFDDDPATIYSSSSGSNNAEWVRYDFGSGVTKAIVEVTLLGRDESANWMQMPRKGWIESSPDGRSWLNREYFGTVAGDRDYVMRRILPGNWPSPAPGTHRFWGIRFNATQDSARSNGITRLQMFASSDGSGADLCTGGSGVSTIPYTGGGAHASFAFDASSSNDYAGDTANGGGDILAYDFGVGGEISLPGSLKIQARSSSTSNNNQAPVDFDLVYSDDGEIWTSQENFTTPATWASLEVRTFAITQPASGRRRQLVNC